VLYEVFNESKDLNDTSWATWKSNAQPCVDQIRRDAPDNMILIGAPFWTQDLEGAVIDRWACSGRSTRATTARAPALSSCASTTSRSSRSSEALHGWRERRRPLRRRASAQLIPTRIGDSGPASELPL